MTKILSLREVTDRTSLSRATIYRKAQSDPTFPPLIQISEGRTGIEEAALADWLAGVRAAAVAARERQRERGWVRRWRGR